MAQVDAVSISASQRATENVGYFDLTAPILWKWVASLQGSI